MKMVQKYGLPTKKCSIKELCTSWVDGVSRDRWCSDEEFIHHICEIIRIGIMDLEDMKIMLYKEDYYKVLRHWNKHYKYAK